MNFWNKVKRDMRKGVNEGITVLKDGLAFLREKAEELTEEGKKRYRIYSLKARVQKEMADLGGKVYDLQKTRRNPLLDASVQSLIQRIARLEEQIARLEGVAPAPKKTTRPRKTTQKSASRKTTATRKTKEA